MYLENLAGKSFLKPQKIPLKELENIQKYCKHSRIHSQCLRKGNESRRIFACKLSLPKYYSDFLDSTNTGPEKHVLW